MIGDKREKQILAAVDGLADDILGFTSRLVAEESTLGHEQSVLSVMESELRELGFSPRRIPIDPGSLASHPGFAPVPWDYANRYCLVATQDADGSGGSSALFNGHLDVVSAAPLSFWESDPFDPVIKNGWLYGRGAGDMKAGVAAMVYAVYAVKKAGFGLKAPVTIETVIEEECSGNGALACLAAGYDGEAVLIPEPFGPTILTSQLGVFWFKVTVSGVPRHVLAAGTGINAIEKCFPLIEALHRLEDELNREARPPAFRGMQHPLNLNIGMIHGGEWPSTVAAQAEFHGRLSFFPETRYEDACHRVTETIAKAGASDGWLRENPPVLEFYGFRSEGFSVAMNQPAFSTLNACHRDLAGKEAQEYTATCTTDLRAFHFFGKGQATCFGPVARNIHAANEAVNIESIIHVARAYALFLSRWCGVTD